MEGSGAVGETAQFTVKNPPTITSEPRAVRFFNQRVCLPRLVSGQEKIDTFHGRDRVGCVIHFFGESNQENVEVSFGYPQDMIAAPLG